MELEKATRVCRFIASFALGCASACSLHASRATSTAALEQGQLARAGPDYRAIVVEPFVVVTNAPPATTHEAEVLVTAVRQCFREEMFPTAPDPMTIWVFADVHAFQEEAARLGELDQSSFYRIVQENNQGPRPYFNPWRNAAFVFPEHQFGLRRSLVHELVHAYVEANHPRASTWIHEGVASLFGYATWIREGRTTIGPPEWFPILMDLSYRKSALPHVEDVVDATYPDFHFREDEGGYYEVSSFVIYWLYEHRLLARFLSAYGERRTTNVSSAKTLAEVSGRSLSDLDAELRRFASDRASALRARWSK